MPDSLGDPTAPVSAGSVADLPDWARTELTNVRQEAAQRRVELRAKETEAAEATAQITALTEAKATAEADLASARDELLRLRVALSAGVPVEKAEEFAARLRGSTETELRADAESAKSLFTTPGPDRAVDPSQGRGSDDDPVSITPQAAFTDLIRRQFEGLPR